MDLEERSRLRKLLLELGSLPPSADPINRTRRRGRIALAKINSRSPYFFRKTASSVQILPPARYLTRWAHRTYVPLHGTVLELRVLESKSYCRALRGVM